MGVIYLVRHAQASFAATNYDQLSALGEVQSRHLGDVLRQRGIDPLVVIAGSQRRQQETARLTLLSLGIEREVYVDPGWAEYDHLALLDRPEYHERLASLGAGDGPERRALYDQVLADASGRWVSSPDDGGYPESFGAFRLRVSEALQRASDRLDRSQQAVVFTSGGPIGMVATQLSEAPDKAWLRLNRVMVNTGISKVVAGRRGLSLVTFNEQGHLEGQHAALFSYR